MMSGSRPRSSLASWQNGPRNHTNGRKVTGDFPRFQIAIPALSERSNAMRERHKTALGVCEMAPGVASAESLRA